MKELIDKAAVVAEIERRIKERDFQMKSGCWVSSTYMYEDLLDFLDTLEIKEVDLEKEMGKYLDVNDIEFGYQIKLLDFAKYFFELGLNAQKGE